MRSLTACNVGSSWSRRLRASWPPSATCPSPSTRGAPSQAEAGGPKYASTASCSMSVGCASVKCRSKNYSPVEARNGPKGSLPQRVRPLLHGYLRCFNEFVDSYGRSLELSRARFRIRCFDCEQVCRHIKMEGHEGKTRSQCFIDAHRNNHRTAPRTHLDFLAFLDAVTHGIFRRKIQRFAVPEWRCIAATLHA